jgi:hypothetical protein
MAFWQTHLAVWLGNPNLWSALTAIGTIALAAVTYAIIRQNHTLILQNRQDQLNEDRRHRDAFKPICALVPRFGIDPPTRGDLLELVPPNQTHQNHGLIHLSCTLRNTGSGPALNLSISIRYILDTSLAIPPIELSPLGAGEVRGETIGGGDLGCRQDWLVPLSGAFNVGTFLALQKGGFEFILDYTDVFGKPFRSIHRVAPCGQDTNISAGRVPWFTYDQNPKTSPPPPQ